MEKNSTEVKNYQATEQNMPKLKLPLSSQTSLVSLKLPSTREEIPRASLVVIPVLWEAKEIVSSNIPSTSISSSSQLSKRQEEKQEELFEPRKCMSEAKERINKRDPVQASEKLYKVVEYYIRSLAETYDLPQYRRAKEQGSWWSNLLSKAAKVLANKLNEEKINVTWAKAFDLHRHGFHDNSLTTEDVEREVTLVEWFLNYAEEKLRRRKDA